MLNNNPNKYQIYISVLNYKKKNKNKHKHKKYLKKLSLISKLILIPYFQKSIQKIKFDSQLKKKKHKKKNKLQKIRKIIKSP